MSARVWCERVRAHKSQGRGPWPRPLRLEEAVLVPHTGQRLSKGWLEDLRKGFTAAGTPMWPGAPSSCWWLEALAVVGGASVGLRPPDPEETLAADWPCGPGPSLTKQWAPCVSPSHQKGPQEAPRVPSHLLPDTGLGPGQKGGPASPWPQRAHGWRHQQRRPHAMWFLGKPLQDRVAATERGASQKAPAGSCPEMAMPMVHRPHHA